MHTKGVLALVLITTLTLSPLTPATATDSPMGSIGVHGHWEIEVRNPDGSLAARREFDNALFDNGALLLGSFLIGGNVPGSWAVFFVGAPTPCQSLSLTGQTWCFIVESRMPIGASAQGVSKNLVVTTDPLKLSGSITLPIAGSITTVQTVLDVCLSNMAPASCIPPTSHTPLVTLSNRWITGTSIAPINVLAGQLVTITITFTFSSAP